jgi:hypothetical protein
MFQSFSGTTQSRRLQRPQQRVKTRVPVDEADFYHDKMQFATQKSFDLVEPRVGVGLPVVVLETVRHTLNTGRFVANCVHQQHPVGYGLPKQGIVVCDSIM